MSGSDWQGVHPVLVIVPSAEPGRSGCALSWYLSRTSVACDRRMMSPAAGVLEAQGHCRDADVYMMNLRRALFSLCLIAAACISVAPYGSVVADSVAPDPEHPFSDPVWWPLRDPARVSCAKTNCEGPYHGYDAIDFIGELGAPVHAAGAGILHIGGVSAGCGSVDGHAGTWVWVDHGPAGSTRYYHLDTITASEGDYVTPATQIGTMGHSGDAAPCTTNYLHRFPVFAVSIGVLREAP